MVVLLGFTVFKAKLLLGLREPDNPDGKRQTIRVLGPRLSKKPIVVGDTLRLYWHLRQRDCEKLYDALCSEALFLAVQYQENYFDSGKPVWRVDVTKRLRGFDGILTMSDNQVEILAKKDGFDSAEQMMSFLHKVHPNVQLSGINPQFECVRW